MLLAVTVSLLWQFLAWNRSICWRNSSSLFPKPWLFWLVSCCALLFVSLSPSSKHVHQQLLLLCCSVFSSTWSDPLVPSWFLLTSNWVCGAFLHSSYPWVLWPFSLLFFEFFLFFLSLFFGKGSIPVRHILDLAKLMYLLYKIWKISWLTHSKFLFIILRVLLASLVWAATWLSNFISLSTKTPRSFSLFVSLNIFPYSLYWFFWLLIPQCMTLHLSVLNFMSFISDHFCSFLKSSSSSLISSSVSTMCIILVSSAKILSFDRIPSFKSLMNIRKRSGPITEPRVTSEFPGYIWLKKIKNFTKFQTIFHSIPGRLGSNSLQLV